MTAISVGTVYVSVLPDVKRFASTANRKLIPEAEALGAAMGKAMARRINEGLKDVHDAKVGADTKAANVEIDRLNTKLDKLSHKQVSASVKVNSKGLSGLQNMNKLMLTGATAATAFGPAVIGVGAALAGAAVAAGSAAVGLGAYGAIAVPMFKKVTTAQQAYTKARQQYDQATTKAGRAAALKKEQAALDSLTPSEKKLAVALDKTKASWAGLNKAVQPIVASSLGPWLDAANRGIKLLPNIIKPAASAMSFLGDMTRNALTMPVWKQFSKNIGSSGKIALQGFGSALLSVGTGLAYLFNKFKPWIDKIAPAVAGWGASFQQWAQNYKTSGFQHFLSYLGDQGPTLKGIFQDLKTTMPKVADAFKGMPSTTLGLFKDVLDIISKMSPGQIQALAYTYAAAKLGGSIGGLGIFGGGKKGSLGAKLPLAAGSAAAGIYAANAGTTAINGALQGSGNYQGHMQSAVSHQAYQKKLPGVGADTGILGSINNFNKRIANTIWSAAATGIDKIPGLWSHAYEGFQKNFGSKITNWFTVSLPHFFSASGGAIASAGSSLAHGLGNGWNSASTWVSTQFGHAYSWISTKFAGAGRWLSGTGSSIGHGLGNAWNATGGWLVKQFSRGYGWVTSRFAGAGRWLSGTGSSIGRGLGNAWNAAGGWIVKQFGRGYGWITSRFAGAGRWLSGTGSSVARGLGNAWNAAGGWLVGQIRRGYGWVTGPFKGAGGWLAATGRNIISGLWSGMKSIWSKVTGWISGIAGWIKQHKGPLSYDKTLLIPNGRALMQGLHVGLLGGFGTIQDLISGMASAIGGAFSGGSGVARWTADVQTALKLLGQPLSWTSTVLRRMNQESGGNPNAINLWDSNAKAGHPSQGLMQTIPSTFNAYAGPFRKFGILNPLANIFAGLNYALHTYGSLSALNRPGGYALGGNASSGLHWVGEQGPELVNFGRTTRVYTANQSKEMAGAAKGALVDTLNVNVAQSGASAGDIIDAAVYELRKVKLGGAYA